MGYLYCGLWILMACILFYKFRKESKIVYVLCAYFIFAGVWWFLNDFLDINMTAGIYGNILRGVSLVMLILLAITYFIEKKKKASVSVGDNSENEKKASSSEFDTDADSVRE